MLFITPHPPLIRIYSYDIKIKDMNGTEIIGYIASATTITSFLMRNVIQLRLVNLAACLMFVFYGLMINSLPVAIVNLVVATINVYYILRYNRYKRDQTN